MNQQHQQLPPRANSTAVLHDLAKSLAGCVTKKKVRLEGGTAPTFQLRALYRGHKIDSNDNLIAADLKENYGQFELLVINPRVRTRYGKPACTTTKHVVFTVDGTLSRTQSELYESGILGQLLAVIDPHKGEEINVSERLVRVYLTCERRT